MKRIVAALFTLLLGISAPAEFSLKEENDVWLDSDNDYTQGLELEWMGSVAVDKNNRPARTGLSLRNVFYTPADIENPEPQPDDHPWAGLTALTLKQQRQLNNTFREDQFMVGVVGEWSYSEQIQTKFHKLIKDRLPLGWHNQLKNEVVANWIRTLIYPMYTIGKPKYLSADVAATCGWALGTAVVYGEGGALVRAGWNMPAHRITFINPSALRLEPTAYVFGRAQGRYYLHNIMLSGSLFQSGPEVDMTPFVTDYQIGTTFGAKNLKFDGSSWDAMVTLGYTQRSEEYDLQDGTSQFGTIILTLGTGF